jgi:hypothetical protein
MAKVRIIFTRHAERLPSGKLSPEGLKHAKDKGRALSKQATVLFSYASNHPSKRAYDTAKVIADASGIAKPAPDTGTLIEEVEDFSYDVFKPELKQHLSEAKDRIDAATLAEIGLSTERDVNGELKIKLEDLPTDQQIEIARIRQKNQKLGFDLWLSRPDVVHRLAICMAHRLVDEINGSQKYESYESVILHNVGHGCFAESLLLEGGIHEAQSKVSLKDQRIGYIQPLESFYFEIETGKGLPELIPLYIQKNDGSIIKNLHLSYYKLRQLNDNYNKWSKSKL